MSDSGMRVSLQTHAHPRLALSMNWESRSHAKEEAVCFTLHCPQGQGHAFSQRPSTEQTGGSQMLSRESGCWTAWDPGRAIFSHGEEMINQGSCLLSTWNIPGTMTKTLCAKPCLILKTAPGRWLAVSLGRKQTQR